MKNTKKVLSIFLSVLLLCSAVMPAGAVSVWDIYWSDTEEAARGIIMQPGKDESERNYLGAQ